MYKMLIVDDNAAETECMQFLVQKFAFPLTTRIACNGQEALGMFKREKFDILLTDIKMPYMDGLELSKLVRKMDTEIPIILFSGFSEFSYARAAISLDVLEYLLKPVDPDEFKQTITSVLQSIDKNI